MKNREVDLRKRLNIFLAVVMGLIYCLYCFVLVPLSLRLASDVVYSSSAVVTVIEVIYDIAEIIAISLGYAALIYSMFRYGLSDSIPTVIIFCCVTLFKYVANLCMDWVNYGFDIQSLGRDILVILLPFLLEVLQFLAIMLISHRVISRYREVYGRADGDSCGTCKDDEGVYPFSGVVNRKNPLMRVSLYSGMVVIITCILQSVPYYFTVSYIYGEFPFVSVLSQILGSVIEGVVCYFAVILFLMMFFERRVKMRLYGSDGDLS